MKFKKTLTSLALFSAFPLAHNALAQSKPAATQQLQLSAFVGGTGTFTDLAGGKNLDITAGAIEPAADGALHATIDTLLIDYTGAITQGRLVRGDNPVFITLEVVLEALED